MLYFNNVKVNIYFNFLEYALNYYNELKTYFREGKSLFHKFLF